MKGMDFGEDVGAFAKAEAHIIGDKHSRNCLATIEDFATDGKFDKVKFTALINQLRGKSLQDVLDSANAAQLYQLFVAANTCIEEAGCFGSAGSA